MLALSTADDAGLGAVLDRLGAPAWRARQLRDATWQPDVAGFAEVHQLPRALRDQLDEHLRFSTVEVAQATEADRGNTVKLLCRLDDGQTVETVAMESPETATARRRATVCVSTQVGCAVGCPFCATGQMGLRRSCTAAEVVDQVRAAARELHRRGRGPVTHVVYMGMGEPLNAYDTTLDSVRTLTTRAGISARRITVSTSGVVPRIDLLAGEGIPVTLAVSLHAATDGLRDTLVPLNRRYPLEQLRASARRYAEQSGRRLTLEWCLIGGVNDSDEQAEALRLLARDLRAHVNVIPMNHIDGSPWGPPDAATSQRFLERLRGVRTTVRDTRGGDADAACGQLRAGLERRRILRPDGTLAPMSRVPAATGAEG
ncbi:MAG TPA: 23S rRNA (adenine(2503)-C(2))-methyltransferase RlmN [Candidatus Dormibacteraeota bacterium]|jgi:23S rRNA (adenine2503-C2)-methyltransferase|nr:23S rRNA (adenine(2503)-C(2))-methyltransferase RlmN [Candidatus Dormibacteraeota bacterium]